LLVQRRDLRTNFAAAIDVYRLLGDRTNNVIKDTLHLTKQQSLALDSCPACFGSPSSENFTQNSANQNPATLPSSAPQNHPMPPNTDSPNQNEPTTSNQATQNQQPPQPPLVICLDGNFQHRHHFAGSRNYTELITPNKFIKPCSINEMNDYIKNQEEMHRVRGTVSLTKSFVSIKC
jgi:hypothetical protein